MCDKESTFNCANVWLGRKNKRDKKPTKKNFFITEARIEGNFIRLKNKNRCKKYDHYDDQILPYIGKIGFNGFFPIHGVKIGRFF